MGEFLKALFIRLVLTSTQVELQFSRFSVITYTRSKRLGLAGLAAKAMNQSFKALVDRWRADVLRGLVRRSNNRARPAWVKSRSKGAGTSAFDLYKSDVHAEMRENGDLEGYDSTKILPVVTAAALERWPSEPGDKKAEYEDRAKQNRADAPEEGTLRNLVRQPKSELPVDDTHPLGFASLDGPFPALPLKVEEYQEVHNFAKTVQRFQAKRGFYTKPLEGFPGTVVEERTCRGGPSGCCREIFDADIEDGNKNAKLNSTASKILE